MAKKSKLKIGFLVEVLNNHSGARAPLEIAKHLSDAGYLVNLYAYNTFLDVKTVTDLHKSNLVIRVVNICQHNFFNKFLIISQLVRLLNTDQNDVTVFAGTLPFFIAAKLTQKPIVKIYFGTQFNAYLEKYLPDQKIDALNNLVNKIVNGLIFFSELFTYRLSTEVVAISHYAQKQANRLYKFPLAKCIYLGTTQLAKQSQQKSPSANLVNLLSVSRFTPYKGFHQIIRVLKNLKTKNKFRLTLIGSQLKPAYVDYLKKLSGEWLTININLNDQQLAQIYQQTNIYVTADKYLYFGMPITEAALFEIPAVAMNYAAANEVINHGCTGFVANTQKELKYYLQKLITDKQLRQQMGKNAKKYVSQKFTWQKCAKEWESVFINLVSRNN